MATNPFPRLISSPLRRLAALAAAFALCSPVSAAELARWTIDEGDGPREFSLTDDEVQITDRSQKGAALQAAITAALPGSTTYEVRGKRALVKLATTTARQQSVARTRAVEAKLPAVEVAPVFYRKDLPEGTAAARRIATKELLVKLPAAGAEERVRTQAGAVAVVQTRLAGHVRLVFPDAYAALDGAGKLRTSGVQAEPLLAREMQKRAVPNDPFFPNQWHLQNIGQGGGTFGLDANVVHAWDITKGAFNGVSPMNIGIIDDGLETTHPDLAPNSFLITTNFHYDFNDDDNDPTPDPFFDAHGTAVGGVAAARGDNNLGVSGIAPLAKLVGLRLIAGPSSDVEEAAAFTWNPIGLALDLTNNSWGPFDGSGTQGPGPLARQALEDAATNGRNGKGTVTVFAAGNGLQLDDNANFDGYANSRFVLAVAAINNFGRQSSYSEPGSNILVCAPSSGGSLGIFTTDVTAFGGYNPGPGEPTNLDYTNSFGGTSSASPLVAGGVALVLSANPNLGWRDVHEILASTARQNDPGDFGWVTNGAGFHFNHKYGAGSVDLTAAVIRAKEWAPAPPEQGQVVVSPIAGGGITIPDFFPVTRTFTFGGPNLRVEHVTVDIGMRHTYRADVQITITSPSGTTSTLIPERFPLVSPFDGNTNYGSYIGNTLVTPWSFSSTHHWGENSTGVWTLTISDLVGGDVGQLDYAAVHLHGADEANAQRFHFAQQTSQVGEGDGTATLTVNRRGGTTGTATIDYVISTDSTAIADADFSGPFSGTLTFDDAVGTQNITIPIIDDSDGESSERIYVLLRNPTAAALGGITLHTLTIVDNEAPTVEVSVSDSNAGEAISNLQTANPGEFSISRSYATDQPLTVRFNVTGTAFEALDYRALGGTGTRTAVIPAGGTTVTVPIDVLDDNLTEGNETVVFTIVSSTTYSIGPQGAATLIIQDNDFPQVEIFVSPPAVLENAATPVTFTVKRNGSVALPLNVNLSIFGNALPGENYGPTVPTVVPIPANATTATFQVTPMNNTNYSATTTLFVQLAPSNGSYTDGFSDRARVTFLDDEPLPDSAAPTVLVTSPAPKARLTSTPITASGTAADNDQVTVVQYRVDHGGVIGTFKPATLTPPATTGAPYTWNADLTADVVPGPNALVVQGIDALGNKSALKTVTFNYVIDRTLTVTATPGGRVSPGFSPTSLREAGVTYSITATPQAGFVFNGWTGLSTSPSRTLSFTMPDANATLAATFIASPFANSSLKLTGTYTGLFRPMTLATDTSGLAQVKVTNTGTFTGKIFLAGKTHPFRGELNGSGQFQGQVNRKGSTPLLVTLALDMSGVSGRITGSIGDGVFTSPLVADRGHYDRATQPYAPAATTKQLFTFVQMRGAMPAPIDPLGTGYATMTIDASGLVKWKGRLGDNTKVSQSVPLTKANTFPFFVSLYKGNGLAAGTAAIDTAPATTDLTGAIDWIKTANVQEGDFPGGFTRLGLPLEGSIYVRQPAGTRALPGLASTASNAIATLSDGQLTSPLVKSLDWSSDNKIKPVTEEADRLALSVVVSNGMLRGSFIHPVSGKKTTLEGALLQKSNRALGIFRGTDFSGDNSQTGTVSIVPAPVVP